MYKTKKGLWGLLVVGGLVLLLAAMGSGAWAAPSQSPLGDTIPPAGTIDGFVWCNAARTIPCVNEPVTLDGGPPIYTDANGYYQFTGLAPGSYEVGALGFTETVILGAGEGEGQDFWPGMAPVGGIAIPVNKVGLVAPWIGLAALMGVVGAAVVIRRRR